MFDEKIHKRTSEALGIAGAGGFFAGYIAAQSAALLSLGTAAGLVLYVGAGVAAVWYTPPAERVAIEYQAEEGIGTAEGGG